MSFGITELVIILVIVLLLFGTTKLKSLGGDLGSAIKGFRTAVSDDEKADPLEYAAENVTEENESTEPASTEQASVEKNS